MANAFLTYEEPTSVTILIHASFILALNVVGYCLDRFLYCGLVGNILIGMAWGTPGAKLLTEPFESAITNIGYLGLILLVFEGGLSTEIQILQKNLLLAVCIAGTGVLLPIALSFLLVKFASATKLQAFAAGCALCSTSLGTTFSVLKSCGLSKSKLGCVLAVAAMLDDVVGLVMIQIIQELGPAHGGRFDAVNVIRPVFVSVGFAVVCLLLCFATKRGLLPMVRSVFKKSFRATAVRSNAAWFVASTSSLIAWIAAGAYAGTSVLFMSYLAGLYISWLSAELNADELKQQKQKQQETQEHDADIPLRQNNNDSSVAMRRTTRSSKDGKAGDGQTKPSEASSTNATPRQTSIDDWEDVAGASGTDGHQVQSLKVPEEDNSHQTTSYGMQMYRIYYAEPVDKILKPFFFASIGFPIAITELFGSAVLWRGIVYAVLMALGKLACGLWLVRFSSTSASRSGSSAVDATSRWKHLASYRPQSCYPAFLLASAMTARGEIGFLVAAIAQSNGIFSAASEGRPELFLIATWAILLCTVAGPIAVGLLTKRIRRLRAQERSTNSSDTRDPLGIWAHL